MRAAGDAHDVAAAILAGGRGLAENAELQGDLARVAALFPDVPAILITERVDAADVAAAIQAGAKGYLASTAALDVLVQSLRLLMIGGSAFPGIMSPALVSSRFAPGSPDPGRSVAAMPATMRPGAAWSPGTGATGRSGTTFSFSANGWSRSPLMSARLATARSDELLRPAARIPPLRPGADSSTLPLVR